jgi:hypothetical protein
MQLAMEYADSLKEGASGACCGNKYCLFCAYKKTPDCSCSSLPGLAVAKLFSPSKEDSQQQALPALEGCAGCRQSTGIKHRHILRHEKTVDDTCTKALTIFTAPVACRQFVKIRSDLFPEGVETMTKDTFPSCWGPGVHASRIHALGMLLSKEKCPRWGAIAVENQKALTTTLYMLAFDKYIALFRCISGVPICNPGHKFQSDWWSAHMANGSYSPSDKFAREAAGEEMVLVKMYVRNDETCKMQLWRYAFAVDGWLDIGALFVSDGKTTPKKRLKEIGKKARSRNVTKLSMDEVVKLAIMHSLKA